MNVHGQIGDHLHDPERLRALRDVALLDTPAEEAFDRLSRLAVRYTRAIPDARDDPTFRDNPAIEALGVIAYLGIPLVTPDRYVLGSFCVIDHRPRRWTTEEIGVVEDLAAAVMTEIHLRAEIRGRRRAEDEREELARLNRRLELEMEPGCGRRRPGVER